MQISSRRIDMFQFEEPRCQREDIHIKYVLLLKPMWKEYVWYVISENDFHMDFICNGVSVLLKKGRTPENLVEMEWILSEEHDALQQLLKDPTKNGFNFHLYID